MKLHLPVKLRASLIAAVFAVSASVYNAYAYDYTNFGTKVFAQTTPMWSGNTYTANELTRYWTDASKATEVSKAADGKWYTLNADGSLSDVEHTEPAGGWITETYAGELVFAVGNSVTPVTVFEGDTTLTADAIKFNNSVVAPKDGVKGVTTIVADEVQINRNELGDPSKVNLEQLNITAGATKLDKFSELDIDNSAAPGEQIDLGAVSGMGGLSIKGGTTEAGDKTSVSMDSVLMENRGDVTLDTVDAIVGGDVAVNSLTLTNTDAAVTGNVTTGGTLTVDADSRLEATGNVLTTTEQGKGNTRIDGYVVSTDGNILLDNGYISGSVTTTSTTDGKGNITLFNIKVKDGATVDASGDLTITGETTTIDNDEQDIIVNAGGDLSVNDGSIIQNVDATVGGGITVDDATVDNSVITGATGDITFINGAQVTDSIINGGRHFQLNETQNDVNIDGTKSINLTGDIKLSNVTREGLELATKGTSGDDVTDYDNEVGGSIIIENSTLSNSSIKSGVQATIAEDGTISYSIQPDGITTAASGNPSGALRVPYGHVKVTNSTLTDVTATTKRGNVDIQGTITTWDKGEKTYSDRGDIKKFITSVKRMGLAAADAAGKTALLTSVSIVERNNQVNGVNTPVKLKVTIDGVEYISTNSQSFTSGSQLRTFNFDSIVLNTDTDYTFEFVDAETGEAKLVGVSLVANNTASSTVYHQNGILSSHGLVVSSTGKLMDNRLLGSTVSTDNGALTMRNTYTAAADGKDTNIKATGKSTIEGSMLDGGTNVEITNGDLTIGTSSLLKDVNVKTRGYLDFKRETLVDIDGGEAHDASLHVGGDMWADGDTSVAGDTINIVNADVQVGGRIELYGNGTMNLTNVYAKDADGNKTASDLGRVKTRNASGRGTLNITGSIIDAEAIWSNSGDNQNYNAENGTSIDRYFADVNIDSSDVEVSGRALIENLDIANSSTVAILGGAYLDTTNIDSTSKLTTGGISKLDDVNMADGATIRVTNTGDGATTLANLNKNPETTGTVNVEVVNGTLQTPVVDDRVVLGLNGGTLHLKSVDAHGSALAASVAPVANPDDLVPVANPDDLVPVRAIDPHVVLAAVTNAGGGATATSTIKTDGLNRFQSYAAGTEGTRVTADNLYRYLYTVSAEHTVADGEALWVKNANGDWTQAAEGTVLAVGTEVSKLNYTETDAKVQYDGTVADPCLSAVTMVDATRSLNEQAYLTPQKTTTWNDTVEQVVVGTETVDGVIVTYYQKVEAMPSIDYIDGYSKLPGSVAVKNDGIASLTVKGDFGADKAVINAYQLAEPVAYWKDGKAMTVSQYNALSAADKELCTPEYKPSLNVYWNIIDGPAYDGLTGTDLSSADKSVYTKLNPLTCTATETHELTVADYGKLTAEQQGLYVEVPGYIANNGGATITNAQYEALPDAEKAGYTAGTIAYTNTIVKTQVEYDALTDKTGYVQLADGTWEKTNVVTIKTCVLDTFEASSDVDAFDEDRRYFTTITEEAYNALADKDGWTMQEIQSLRDGEGYNSIFVNKNYGHDDDCCTDLVHKDLMASDATGHIVIEGDLSGSDNELNADTTIEIGSITGSGNVLTATESITTGDITGSDNELWAGTTIDTGAITGDENTLTAGTITTGAINGNSNILEGDTITTGDITGSDNALTAGESITVNGKLTGNSNTLIAQNGNVSLNGDRNTYVGNGNTITAIGGDVRMKDDVVGSNNTITATAVKDADGNIISGGNIVSSNKWSTVIGNDNTLTADNNITVEGLGLDSSNQSNGNTLTAGGNIWAANSSKDTHTGIFGSDNTLTAGQNIDAGTVKGSNNTLTATDGYIDVKGDVKNTDATKDGNTLEAGSYINLQNGQLAGDGNKLTSHGVSNTAYGIRLGTGLAGNNNELTADEGRIILDPKNGVSLNGTGNIITAKGANSSGEGIYLGGLLQGNDNTLTAETGSISTGAITSADDATAAGEEGKGNTLTASGAIKIGAITGDCNELTSQTGSITLKDNVALVGEYNTLTADTSITTGAIIGSTNTLTAETGAVTTGAINGNSNILDGETITTGAITGASNELTAETITTGGINGTTNVLTGTDVTVCGVLQGSDNKVTASTITVDTIAGTAQEIISTGVDKAADTAISIGTLTATDSTIEVLYPNSGSISIDTMSSKAAAGETGTTITTLAGNVTIGTLDDVTSKTSIKVGDLYGISVGSGTASNQTWVGGSLAITGTDGIALTNSTVKMLGDITGTSLSLAADAKGYTSSANNVSLSGNLVLSGKASLNITGDVESGTLSLIDSSWLKAGEVTTGTLTLVGYGVALDITKLTVTEMLDLQGGACLDGVKVTTDADGAALKVTDSTLTSGMLSGFTGVTLDNSVGNLGSSSLTGMTNDVAAVNGSTLIVTSIGTPANVLADNSAITATAGISAADVTAQNKGTITTQGGNIVATGAVTADNGEIKTNGGDITAGSMVITNGGEISADDVVLHGALKADGGKLTADTVSGATIATLNGASITGSLTMADGDGADVTATNGTTIGAIANADAVTLEGASKVNGNVGMNGALNMGGESAIGGNVTGATSATLKEDATITGALAMQGDNADVNATVGSIGSITGANKVTTTETIMGDVSMNGELTMTKGTAASVTGANGATLTNATITGVLNATCGAIEADGGSIGSITGSATTVDLDGTQIGSIDMATNGDLIVKDTTTGAVNAANGNTVANATLTNATIGSGLNVTYDMTATGDVTVDGDVTVSNDLSVNTGTLTAENVTVAGTTTLTGGTVDVAGTFHSTNVELVDIVGEMDELIADKGLSLSGTTVTVKDVISVGKDMTLTSGANVTNKGAADIEGDLTVTDSIFTNKGAVEVGGATKVTDGTLTGTTLTTDGLTVDGADKVEFTTITSSGDVTVVDAVLTGDVTAIGDVTLVGATTDAVVAAGGVTATASTINGAFSSADVTLAGTDVNGNVEGADVTLTGSTVLGAVVADGTVDVTGSNITETVDGRDVNLTDANVGSVTADGAATLAHTTIDGDLNAGDTVVSSDVTVMGSAIVAGLTVKKESELIADELTANGKLDIQDTVTTTTGNVTLTGTEGSSIAADVTSAGDVIIAGTVAATEAALKGANVTINGTLDAGKGVSFIGTVNGAGTIVKTGGDTLALAGDTKIGGVTVKGSTLAVDGGATIGKLTVSDKSTVEIGNNVVFGTLTATSSTLELVGNNRISGNVQMLEGGWLAFGGDESGGMTWLTGDLSFSGGGILLRDYTYWSGQNEILLYVDGSVSGWNENPLDIHNDADGPVEIRLVNGDLFVLNYNAETFKPYFKGDITVTTRQTDSLSYRYYNSVSFENIKGNGDYTYGGAIYGGADSTITLSDNGSVTFNGNTVTSSSAAEGGAIRGYESTIELSNNGSVEFSGNTASATGSYAFAEGGAIYGYHNSTIELSNNGSVVFEGNTASSGSFLAYGGAIYGYYYSPITLSNNGSVTFSGNTAGSGSYHAEGGAIYGYRDSTITLSNNGSVMFSGNTASSGSDQAEGGAIYGYSDSPITLSNNGSVTFSGNMASSSDDDAYGGAIYGDGDNTITLSDNGSVTFSGNTASSSSFDALGGAIYGEWGTITLSDNGSVTFSGNTASGSSYANGGAIYTQGDLSIRNNDSVESYQNAEVVNGNTYRLRSIYAGGSGDVISLSAAAGKSITFYDSVYIGSGATVNLNQDYTYQAEDGSSVTIRQQGDIVFTGKYTEQHLNDLLEAASAGRTATAQEILNSRTTVVNAMTNLYGGRLRVEEGAIYQGRGITAMEGSAATVRVQNATLSHSGYDLTFNAGTTLELAGNNTIAGNVQMLGSSSLVFDNTHGNGTTDIIGSLGLGHGADVSFVLGKQAYGSNEVLLYVSDAVSGWDAAHLMVQGNSYTADSFTWVDNLLVLNYDESSFNRYFNGSANYNERLVGDVIRLHYESLAFTTETSSSQGSAIYGAGSAVILLSGNGSVSFSGNTASGSSYACGGAIYVDRDSTITLSDNGSVTFSGNTASSSDSYPSGGAIYGYNGSTITLSDNGSVTFSGNTASSSSDSHVAYGGAIYGNEDSTITLSDNGSVTFSGNTASGPSYSDCGGAIYGRDSSTITLSDNGSVSFSGNTASGLGGAIYTKGDLSIRNNESVEFYQNAEANDGVYRLRSIYADAYGDEISLSAAAGKSITFRDSVYISSGGTFKLNEQYEGKAQLGDIIFTGATTVDDLYTVNNKVAGTTEEIRLSRTSVVNTLTELYGGRLRVEEGAIYQGRGITAMEGSGATVRVQNATLSHSGYDLTFNAGTTLELEGANTISGNVQMLDDSTLRFIYAADTTLSLTGNLSFDGSVTIELVGYGEGNYELVSQNGGTLSGWYKDALRFMNGQGESLDASRFSWVDSSLYFMNSDFQSIVWTNATGDGLWNNASVNWNADGTPFASTVMQNVILGAGGSETITMEGNQVVNSLTVQQGGQYVLAGNTDDTCLTVREYLSLENGAALVILGDLDASAVHDFKLVNSTAEVEGNVTFGGTLSVDAGAVLTVNNATGWFYKKGEGSLVINNMLGSQLNLNYEGTLIINNLILAENAVLTYGLMEGSLLQINNLSSNVVVNVMALQNQLAEGINLGLSCSISADKISVLCLKADEYTLQNCNGYWKLFSDVKLHTDWDMNWGPDTIASSPMEPATVAVPESGDFSLVGTDADNQSGCIAAVLTGGGAGVSVFGGSALSNGTSNTAFQGDTWIRAEEGQYKLITGGHFANSWGSGTVGNFTGDTHIVVDGATVGSIVGGSHQDGRGPRFTGNSYISIFSGDVTAAIVGAGTNAHGNTTHFNGTTNIYVYVPLSTNIQNGMGAAPADAVIGAGTSFDTVSRGCTNNLTGATNVTVDLSGYTGDAANFAKKLIGGHYNWFGTYQANIIGDTNVNIIGNSDVTFTADIVGGSRNNRGSINTTGTSSVNISGASTYSSKVVAGSYLAGNFTSTTGGTKLSISGGTFNGAVYGGAYHENAGTSTTGDVVISLAGGTFADKVVAGSHLETGAGTLTVGDTSVSVSGGTVNGDLIGGLYINGTGDEAVTASMGDSTIIISGGKVTNVYGGTYTVRNKAEATITQGDIVINLQGGEIAGDVYAAGYQGNATSLSTESTTVNLSAAVAIADGKIISGGYKTSQTNSVITGDSTLVFTGTQDRTGVSLTGFNKVEVAEKATATVGALPTSGVTIDKVGAGVLATTVGVSGTGTGVTVNVNEGTLLLSGTASMAASTVNVATGATLEIATTQELNVGTGSIAGTGSLVKSGTGAATVDILGADWAGDITVNGGTLNLSAMGGTTSVEVKAGAALNVAGDVMAQGSSIGSITGAADLIALSGTTVKGDVALDTTGTLKVTNGEILGSVANEVANATLENASIGSGLTVTDKLTSVGNVTVKGDVTTNDLKVSNGTLYAKDGDTLYDVTVANKTTLSNGEVVAGTFTTKELELVDLAGEVEKLIAEGNVAMAGTTLDVTKTDADAVKVGGSMTLTQGAILTNAGGAQITGDLKVDGSAFTNEGAVQAGSIAVKAGGVLAGTTVTANGVTVTNGTITGAVLADSAVLADATFGSGLSVTHDMEVAGQVSAQGSVAVGGKLTGTGVLDLAGALTVGSLQAGALETQMLTLTTQDSANTVSGDLTAGTVSLAAGSSLSVGGVLTANEVQMTGTALTLTAGSFGASSMNFVLDRAALESLGLGYRESGTIAQVDSALAPGFVATLNGGTKAVQAAAYKYTISVSDSSVQLAADYRWKLTKVWYRGAWVGESSWEDYRVNGFDAVNGVERINLAGGRIDDYLLTVELEDGVSAVEMTNGSLAFDYVDILAGRLNIGQGASLAVRDELYGEDMVLGVSDSSVSVDGSMEVGTVELVNSSLLVHDATIGALNATSSEMTITAGGKVTIGSDVTLSGFVNSGSLDMDTHKLVVENIVRNGGSVTAGEVEVLCNNRTAASFNKLVADEVTVKQANEESSYPDFLSVGNGSAIGELVAEKLEVREGTVTLGYADKATEQTIMHLALQDKASLVLNQQTGLSVGDSLTAAENATVQLKQDAALNYQELCISNKHADKTVSVNAAQLAANSSELVLQDAHVKTSSSGTYELGCQLVNSSVEHTGSGTLQVTNGNNTLSSLVASGGDVEVYNASAPMSLQELHIAAGLSVNIMTGGVDTAIDSEHTADVTVVGMAEFEQGATLNANLTLASGSTLVMDGSLHMEGALELVAGDGTITLSGAMYDALTTLEMGESLTLFTGVDSLTLTNDGISVTYRPDELHGVLASDYFGNLPVPGEEAYYYITYTSTAVDGGELAIMLNIPEPTTATLSLLALASLAARRRRKG